MSGALRPYYDREGITIYHADCAEVMPHLPHFDLLLTDPPYGVNITKHNRMKSALGQASDTWDAGIPSAEQIERLKAAAKWQIIWGGNFFPLGPTANYMVWHKQNDGLRFSEHELAWTNLKTVPRHFALRPQGNMGGGRGEVAPNTETDRTAELVYSAGTRGRADHLRPLHGQRLDVGGRSQSGQARGGHRARGEVLQGSSRSPVARDARMDVSTPPVWVLPPPPLTPRAARSTDFLSRAERQGSCDSRQRRRLPATVRRISRSSPSDRGEVVSSILRASLRWFCGGAQE